jgi:hypothetical protein
MVRIASSNLDIIMEPEPIEGKKGKVDSKAYDIIRTVQRNHIDLKAIADNKANILMSLNAIMLTLMVPAVLTHLEVINQYNLAVAVTIYFVTCFSTMILAALVLVPFNGTKLNKQESDLIHTSPFLFRGFSNLSLEQYQNKFKEVVEDKATFQSHIVSDVYYLGKVVAVKYRWISLAYNIFLYGLGVATLAGIIGFLLS